MIDWQRECLEKIQNNATVIDVIDFLSKGNYNLNQADDNGMTLMMHLVTKKAYNSYTQIILETSKSGDESLRKYVNLNLRNKNGQDAFTLATAAGNKGIEPVLNNEKIRKKRLETMYETHKNDPTIPKLGYHETSEEAFAFIEADRKKEKYPMIGGVGGYFGGGIYFAATKEESSEKALHHGYGLECPLRMGNIYKISSLTEKEHFYKIYFKDESTYDVPTDVIRERLLTYNGESYDSVWGHYDESIKKIEDRILPTGDEYVVYSADQLYVKETFIVVQNHWLSKNLKVPRIYDPFHTPDAFQPGDVYLNHLEESYFRIQFAYKEPNGTIQLTEALTVGDDTIDIPYKVCKDIPNCFDYFKPLLPFVDRIHPMATDPWIQSKFKELGKASNTLVSVLNRYNVNVDLRDKYIKFKHKKLNHKRTYPIVNETFVFKDDPKKILQQLTLTPWVITQNAEHLKGIRLVAIASDKENRLSLLSPGIEPTMKSEDHFIIRQLPKEPLEMYAQCLEWLAFFKEEKKLYAFKQFRERLNERLNARRSTKPYALKPHYRAIQETLASMTDQTLRTNDSLKNTPLDIYDVMYRVSNFTIGMLIQNDTDTVAYFILENKHIKDTNGYYKSLDEPLGDSMLNTFNRKNPYPPPKALEGHRMAVQCIAFNPEGTLLASGSEDRTIQLWRTDNHTNVATLKGHTAWVNAVAFSPDGTLMASGSSDKTVRLWRVSDYTCVATLEGHTNLIECVAFQPYGTLLASGSFDGFVILWDTTVNRMIRMLSVGTAQVYSMAFSPDGKTLAVGNTNNIIQFWNIASHTNIQLMKSLKGHTSYVVSLAFSPNGKRLASGSADKTIRIWRTSDYTCEAILKEHSGWGRYVAFHPDGNTMAVVDSSKKDLWLWRMRDFKHIATLQTQVNSAMGVAFHPLGTMLASGSVKGNVYLWDISTPKDIPVTIPGLTLDPPQTNMEPILVKHNGQIIMHLYPWNRMGGKNPNFGKEVFIVKDAANQILVKVKDTDIQFNLSVYFDHLETERSTSGGRRRKN